MSTEIRILRSSAPSMRAKASDLGVGQPMVNYESSDPGLYFRLDNGTLMKTGPCYVGPNAPNSNPASGGETGNAVGEFWVDTSGNTQLLKIYTPNGWQTLTLSGPTGEKGNKGEDGEKGEKGLDGSPGSAGSSATVDVGLTTVVEEANAAVTNSGTTSAAIFDFAIPKGEKGEPGSSGTGSSTTVDVGSTTVVDAASAAVTNSGTTSDAIFDFALPKGEKGDPGTDTLANGAVTITVHNGETGTLFKGRAVYVSGTYTSGIPIVKLADSDGSGTYPAVGLVYEDILDGDNGQVVISGVLDGFDTDSEGWDAGTALYLTTVIGDLSATRPTNASEKVQKVAVVTKRDATNGAILVMGAGRTNDVPNELTALLGTSLNDTDLGTFTGVTITDDSSIKVALQELETEVETKADVDGVNIPGPYNNDNEAGTDGVLIGGIYKNANGTVHWRVT